MGGMDLSHLPRGARARIDAIVADDTLTRKLLEMGFLEGAELCVLHTGPIGRDPLAVELNDRCVALRRRDASHIQVTALG